MKKQAATLHLTPEVRLNKFLASSGVCSRREADEYIRTGKVRINGKKAILGMQVDTQKDTVEIFQNEWKKVILEKNIVVYALNKPVGYVSTASDPDGKKTVVSLVPRTPRVFPVGRLDEDSSGLLLLTNDGDLAQKLTHPKSHVEKEYRVVCIISKSLTENELQHHLDKVRRGVLLKEGRTQPATVTVRDFYPGRIVLGVTISEGRRRQIRRSMQKIQLTVVELERIRIGELTLSSLHIASGKYKELTEAQILQLTSGVR